MYFHFRAALKTARTSHSGRRADVARRGVRRSLAHHAHQHRTGLFHVIVSRDEARIRHAVALERFDGAVEGREKGVLLLKVHAVLDRPGLRTLLP